MSTLFKSLLRLLFPRPCCGCGRPLAIDEPLVCCSCQLNLPLEMNHDWEHNRRKLVWNEHKKLVRMGAFALYERDNITAEIVKNLKFRHRYELGDWMGRTAVQLLKDSGLFDDIDAFIPIPLHKSRLYSRGFNQADMIAEGLSAATGIPVRSDIIMRFANRESQTHMTTPQRLKNADRVFRLLKADGLEGLHLMLVDDVMTTGTTMLDAVEVLEPIPNVKISTFAWAWTATMPPVRTS